MIFIYMLFKNLYTEVPKRSKDLLCSCFGEQNPLIPLNQENTSNGFMIFHFVWYIIDSWNAPQKRKKGWIG